MTSRATVLLFTFGVSGCLASPEEFPPLVQVEARYASKFVHRGMTQVDHSVFEPRMEVDLATRDGGSLVFATQGHLNLTENTGSGWFPDGHEGEFSEIDFTARYARALGSFDVSVGVENYSLADGDEFRFGARGPTTEIFASGATELWGFFPLLSVHYDVDEAEGIYANLGVDRVFSFGERWQAEAGLALGWSDEDHSFWAYGEDDELAGFSDLGGRLALLFQANDHTILSLGLHHSQQVDRDFDRWFDILGIDGDPTWITAGITWSF